MENLKILLHVCCAPCLAAARATLRHALPHPLPPVDRIFFYNPNIHPLLEFRRRSKALKVYLERDPLDAEIDDNYGLTHYLGHVPWDGPVRDRCAACYRMRLEKTAGMARDLGLSGFSSTLLASREQDRDLVADIGRDAARNAGVEFHVADLRRFLPDEATLRGIYKQQYCGCVFSENERYRNTAKHLYLPGGKRDDKE